jgi:hypothetical protein
MTTRLLTITTLCSLPQPASLRDGATQTAIALMRCWGVAIGSVAPLVAAAAVLREPDRVEPRFKFARVVRIRYACRALPRRDGQVRQSQTGIKGGREHYAARLCAKSARPNA